MKDYLDSFTEFGVMHEAWVRIAQKKRAKK